MLKNVENLGGGGHLAESIDNFDLRLRRAKL